MHTKPFDALRIIARLACVVALFGVTRADAVEPRALETFDLRIEALGQTRQLWVYLPPDYAARPDKRYPVLYMLDGQYIFERHHAPDASTAARASARVGANRDSSPNWQTNRTLDRLFYEHKNSGLIVVGIDSGTSYRSGEYSPWVWASASLPRGRQIAEFIATSVKPAIDARYRTLSDRQHTGIAGSSLGGTFALYTALQYQDKFAIVAAFSPLLTPDVFGDRLRAYIRGTGKSAAMRFYVDLGDGESEFGPLSPILDEFRHVGFGIEETWFRQIHGGQHRIEDWRGRLPIAVLWLYRA